MSARLFWLRDELARWGDQGLLRQRRTVLPLGGGRCRLDGRELLDFASNDYLDLAHDPRVIAAAQAALAEAGCGARASALVIGRTEWHARLERRLAAFEGEEAAVLFPSGYAANVGTMAALVGADDVVFCDRFNHASLVDGCRFCGARLRIYRHDDLAALDRELAKAAIARRRWIVTDSLFSMDGDAAPLIELCALAERHAAAVLIDEAHATGIYGDYGRGLAEALGVEERVAVRVGTLSKALGSLGGFVAGSHELIDWLWNRARTQMFSTALPPAACAAACAALELVAAEPWRRKRVLALSARLRERLVAGGVPVAADAVGPIVPVVIGDPGRTVRAAERLMHQGLCVGAIRPPTVPRGTSRLRISLCSGHGEADVDRLADALAAAIRAT